VLLEMLIAEVERTSVSCFFCLFWRAPCPPLLWTQEKGLGLQQNPRGCLGEEGGTSTVGAAVVTCLGACRPSLGHHGDVDDGTVGHPGCCRGRAISCGRRAGVIPLLTNGGRGRVRT
jgi:hypothetical protein